MMMRNGKLLISINVKKMGSVFESIRNLNKSQVMIMSPVNEDEFLSEAVSKGVNEFVFS